MGYIFSLFFSNKKEYFISLIGCENTGKTTLIDKLRRDNGIFIPPNIGFENEVNYKKMKIKEDNLLSHILFKKRNLYEKNLYIKYINGGGVNGIIFVVDSSDKEEIQKSFEILLEFFTKIDNKIPILIIANKQDVEGTLSLNEISYISNLKNLYEKEWKIIGASLDYYSGFYKGLDWLDSLL